MRTEPVDLDLAEVRDALRDWWGLPVASLTYCPRGFGSHHWVAADAAGHRWFVTVDKLHTGRPGDATDEAFSALERAFQTAVTLRDEAHLEFVVAPLRARAGSVLRRLGSDYAVSLFPYLEGESSDFGEFRSERDRNDVLRLLGRLHQATSLLPVELPRREDFAIPHRDELIGVLRELDMPWTTGPFGEPARKLLQTSEGSLRAALDRYDAVVAEVSASPASWVVTHGEPHAGNVMRSDRDELWLIDWDTVAVGPRERDLWMVLSDDPADLAAYSETAGSADYSRQAIMLYRLWWDLTDIAEFVTWFRGAHERTADIETGWNGLANALPVRAELLG